MSSNLRDVWADITKRPLFSSILLLGAVALGAGAVVSILTPEREPWGSYPDGVAFHGELMSGEIVTRHIDEDGRPIIDSDHPEMHVVRCGPPVPIEVVSTRFYFVGESASEFVRSEGSAAPFRFEPIDSVSGCGVISFTSVPVDPELAGDQPIQFRLDIVDVTGTYRPVSVRSELMVFGDPHDGTIDSIKLTVPQG